MRRNFQKVLVGLSIVLVFFMVQAGPAFGDYSLTTNGTLITLIGTE